MMAVTCADAADPASDKIRGTATLIVERKFLRGCGKVRVYCVCGCVCACVAVCAFVCVYIRVCVYCVLCVCARSCVTCNGMMHCDFVCDV